MTCAAEPVVKKPSNDDELEFCPGCFATNEGGSWGCTAEGGYCFNCGSTGTVKMPRWAVDSIRRSASWVGKRYYPSEEDLSDHRELRYLRHIAPPAPIEAIEIQPDPAYAGIPEDRKRPWMARRGDTTVSSYETKEQALVEGNKALRYPVPADFEAARVSRETGKAT